MSRNASSCAPTASTLNPAATSKYFSTNPHLCQYLVIRKADSMELRATPLWMTGIRSEDERKFVQVLGRAISGDISAFEQIVIRYERRVLNLAWRLLGNGEDAQDASQEVFMRAFRFLHKFDSTRPFEPWLFRLTINVCRDIGRKRTVTVLLDPDAF